MNISSIIIRVMPDKYDKLVQELEKSDLCDYHFGDKSQGKIIVTIEGENVDEEIQKTSLLQQMPNVLAADMIQTYQEDLDGAVREIGMADDIPDILKSNDTKIEDIQYNGDLKKKNFHGGV